jgi:hypothetical protein
LAVVRPGTEKLVLAQNVNGQLRHHQVFNVVDTALEGKKSSLQDPEERGNVYP